MTKVNGIEVELLPGMTVQRHTEEMTGDYDYILYRHIEILTADPDYKLELRPGPFFIFDWNDDMHEFNTLKDAKDFIDTIKTWLGVPQNEQT